MSTERIAVGGAASNGQVTGDVVSDSFFATDYGNAERLVAQHGADLRYVPGPGWHVWDGLRFRRNDDGAVMRRMKETIRAIEATAAATESDNERRALLSHALKSEGAPRLNAAIELAKSEAAVVRRVEDLDADPDVVNVGNGLLHLPTADLWPHDREALCTKLIPIDFDPDARAPLFLSFLDRIFAGDQERIDFLQRYVGYALTGHTREQVVLIAYGSGANGKTTLTELLRDALGEYAQQAPADTFLEKREGIPNDVARLRGARFVSATETPEGRRLNEVLVKRLVGGDTITARFMRDEWFEFRPVFTPWISTNHRPIVRGTDEAIWRRIRLLPFDVTIPVEKRDHELLDKLRAELPGVLAWAAEGARAWYHDGLGSAAAVTAATGDYRAESDLLGTFIEDVCVVAEQVRAKAGDLYTAYESWCDQNGISQKDPFRLSQQALGRALAERGFEQTRTKTARWWNGISVRHDAEEGR
jgi:putative DNA primase/helicase